MIEIGTDWALKSDEMCVTLLKKTIARSGNQKGKAIWITKGYYNDFSQALQDMVNKDIQGLEKLEYMISRLEELKSEIKASFPKSTKT